MKLSQICKVRGAWTLSSLIRYRELTATYAKHGTACPQLFPQKRHPWLGCAKNVGQDNYCSQEQEKQRFGTSERG